jgi:hypothetical protein
MRNRIHEFPRLLAGVAALPALLLLLVFWSCGAFAQTTGTCAQWKVTTSGGAFVGSFEQSAQQALLDGAAYCNGVPTSSACGNAGCSVAGSTCTYAPGAITWGATFPNVSSASVAGSCSGPCGGTHSWTLAATLATTTAQCPNCPAAGAGTLYGIDAIDASGASCHAGCLYTTPAPSLQIHCSVTSGACSSTSGVVESSSTGSPCGQSQATSSSPVDSTNPNSSQCDSSGTVCADTSSGKSCGTFNGDEVCVGTVRTGTCVSYASGGVACAASTAPPVPNNGTPGTPATAAMQVSANGQTVNYYTSTQISTSTTTTTTGNPVQSQPTGTQGLGGGTGGSVTVSGSVAVSADPAKGDCGAAGVNCAGDATTPTLPSADTIATTTTNYVGALSSVPIVAAVSGISASIPTGTCPTGSFSVYGSTYTIDAQCSLWASVSAIVQLVMLAVWALAGVRILMSA